MALEVAETEVVLTRKSNAKRTKGRHAPADSPNNLCAVKNDGKDDGAVDTAV